MDERSPLKMRIITALAPLSPPKGQYTREPGFLAYYEICKMGLTLVTENAVKAPYGYKSRGWVGFDDQQSLKYKIAEVIKKKNLMGAMFWALI